ncbi:MAG: hypothetical protein ACLQVI_20515 [Polyangiaceae bacterium]|jgi:hypothetical protein
MHAGLLCAAALAVTVGTGGSPGCSASAYARSGSDSATRRTHVVVSVHVPGLGPEPGSHGHRVTLELRSW